MSGKDAMKTWPLDSWAAARDRILPIVLPWTFLTAALFYIDRRRPIDPDFYWHLRLGERILETGQAIQTDFLTFTRLGAPFVSHQWLTDVLFFKLFSMGDGLGLLLFRAFIAASIVLLLLSAAGGRRHFASYPAVLVSLLIARNYLLFRTRLVSLLLIACLIYLVGRGSKRLLLLPLVFAVWANLHGGFPLGLTFLGAWWLGEFLDERRVKRLLARGGVLLASTAATLLNPYGIEVWQMVLRAGLKERYQISEWLPLWSYPIVSRSFYHLTICWLSIVVLAIATILLWNRLRKAQLLPALLFAGLALTYVRLVPIFALVLVPVLARIVSELIDGGARPRNVWRQTARGAAWVLLVSFCVLALSRGPGKTTTIDPQPDYFPVGVVRVLQSEGMQGNILNTIEWGGYLSWALPDSSVFIDSRIGTSLYTEEVYRDYQSLTGASDDWRELMNRYPIDLVVIRDWIPLAEALEEDRGWQKIATDDVAVCFRRR